MQRKQLNVELMKKLYFKSLLLIALMLGCPAFLFGQEKVHLDSTAYASIITCGPGDEFYECFGHSALRICDSSQGLDLVFNWGIFNFDEPFFYLKFAQGTLKYRVAVQRFDNFMWEYIHYGRAVWEQKVNLTNEEINELFAKLIENAKPENMYYKYDFFRDNCATRVDEAITKTIIAGGEPTYQTKSKTAGETPTYQTGNGVRKDVSYRDLLYKYNVSMPWWQLGTDILLGARCDRPLNVAQLRYIPMEMMAQYDTMHRADGGRIAQEKVQILDDNRTPLGRGFSPTLTIWLLFFLIAALTLYGERRGWRLLWLDGIILGLTSFIALLLLFLWFGSDHWCTKWNMNLLWANPLLLWPLFRLRKPKKADCLPMIFILLFALAAWPFGLQRMNAAVLPIILIIIIRLSVRLKRIKKS